MPIMGLGEFILKILQLQFPIRAQPKQRARITRYGAYTPAKTKTFESQLKLLALSQLPSAFEQFTQPLTLEIRFFFTRPKSCPKDRFVPSVKPDLDNLVKAVKDALNQVVWKDDALIVSLTASKAYAPTDSIEVKVLAH